MIRRVADVGQDAQKVSMSRPPSRSPTPSRQVFAKEASQPGTRCLGAKETNVHLTKHLRDVQQTVAKRKKKKNGRETILKCYFLLPVEDGRAAKATELRCRTEASPEAQGTQSGSQWSDAGQTGLCVQSAEIPSVHEAATDSAALTRA